MEMIRADFDVAIIGGGPAGAAAAIEARRRGLSVAVWERGRFPRDKVCGEFISWESLPLVEKLIPDALARGAAITRCEFISPQGRRRGFDLPRPARGLSRRWMDHALSRAAAAAGASVFEGATVRKARRFDPHHGHGALWEIEPAFADKTSAGDIATARSLLLACGRWWAIEGLSSRAAQTAPSWVGLKAHFAGLPARDAVEMFYFRGGYCGLAPVENGLTNVCCLAHSGLLREKGASRQAGGSDGGRDLRSWLARVTRHGALQTRLAGATQVSETVATAPVVPGRRRAPQPAGALLIGDAAGFIDPFTGDGISMALQSGRLAAETLTKALGEGSSPESARQAMSEYTRRLAEAVGGSFGVASVLRILVHAPAHWQAAIAAALERVGPALTAGTRWRTEKKFGVTSAERRGQS